MEIGKCRPLKNAKLYVDIQNQLLVGGKCCSGILGQ